MNEHSSDAPGVGTKRAGKPLEEDAIRAVLKRGRINSDDDERRPGAETSALGPTGCVDAAVQAPAPGSSVVPAASQP